MISQSNAGPSTGFDSQSVIPFGPAARASGSREAPDQLDSAGQAILKLLHEAAGDGRGKQSALPLIWPRSFPTSCAEPNKGSPSWKPMFGAIRKEPTAQSSGFTRFTPKCEIRFITGTRKKKYAKQPGCPRYDGSNYATAQAGRGLNIRRLPIEAITTFRPAS